MRGKGSLNWYGHFSCGITPAYAGKSEDLFYAEVVEEDHPRLCGEKGELCKANKITLGSPPPMRGKALTASRFPVSGWITPAYAGKSYRFCLDWFEF